MGHILRHLTQLSQALSSLRLLLLQFLVLLQYLLIWQVSVPAHAALTLSIEEPNALIDEEHDIKDLAYGHSLFEYYLGNHFSAITQISAYESQQRYTLQQEFAQLVLGSLYLNYGMTAKAEAIFNRLIELHASKATQHNATYQLAYISYITGNDTKTLTLATPLSQDEAVSSSLKQKSLLLLSNAYLRQQQFDKASEALQQLTDTRQRIPLYNLGVSLMRQGQYPQAEAIFEQLSVATASQDLLSDRSYLAQGYNFFAQSKLTEAESAFKNITTQSPYVGAGLIGYGWVATQLYDMEKALGIWHNLKGLDASNPLVQEGYLLIPYGFEELGAYTEALNQYQWAAQSYHHQIKLIDNHLAQIANDNWMAMIAPDPALAVNDEAAWRRLDLELQPGSSDHYLYQLFASHRFSETARGYRELQFLEAVLTHWLDDIPVFHDMLNNQQQRYKSKFAQAEADIKQLSIKPYLDRYQQLRTEFERGAANKDATTFATTEQKALLEKLSQTEALLQQLPAEEKYAAERERFRRVKGLIMWQLEYQFHARKQEANKELTQIPDQLENMEKRIASLHLVESATDQRVSSLHRQLSTYPPRLESLLEQTRQLKKQHGALLQQIAQSELNLRKSTLNDLLARSELSVARIQDKLLMTQEAPE
ncbi:MAG: hypothetical protein CMF25_01795 [Kangiellaceae bacterium]|nr:hypothetical protein [Kangiellaceae bacterium]